MDEQMTVDFAQGLLRLERQNRRLNWFLIAAVTVFGAGLLMGQARPGGIEKKVEAQEFVLLDGEGRLRAVLRMAEGNPELRFSDKDGATRAVLGLEMAGEPYLWLGSKDGEPRAMLGLDVDEALLMLYAKDGKVVFRAP